MAEIVKLCKLSFPEKLNLKAVIKALSSKQVARLCATCVRIVCDFDE